jgi:WD40 repeat protein
MVLPPVRADKKFVVVTTKRGAEAWQLGTDGVTHVAMLEESRPRTDNAWFSRSGDLVALKLDQHQMAVWNLRTGAMVGTPFSSVSQVRITAAQFSPHPMRLAVGLANGACFMIDVTTGRPMVRFANRPMARIHSLRFSPDGTRLVAANDANEMIVWNTSTGDAIGGSKGRLDTKVAAVTPYSPNGRWFATSGVHSIRMWDGETGIPVGKSISVWDSIAAFSADSRSLGTADGHGSVRVWDVPSGHPYTEPMRYLFGAYQFDEFSPDGRFVRAQRGDRYAIWSVPPRLDPGAVIPEWLLQLATVLSGRIVNDVGEVTDVAEPSVEFQALRREIMALPADAPLADWGRWILDHRAERSIAPGFTITPAEADHLAPRQSSAPVP